MEPVAAMIAGISPSISACLVNSVDPVRCTCRRIADITASDHILAATDWISFSAWQTSCMAEDNKRYAMICKRCGSDDVSRDAWAAWDIDNQEWTLRSVYDHAHCSRCGGETRLIEIELAS